MITTLELSGAQAWPALESVDCLGWTCRSSGGYTQRANSCLPLDLTSIAESRIAAVEAYYATKGQPAVFKIPGDPWKALDTVLADRGYSLATPSRVLTKEAQSLTTPRWFRAREGFDESWWQGYLAAGGVSLANEPLARAIASGVERPIVGRVVHDHREAAWAFVSMVDDRAWVFDVFVDPELRGRGLGRDLMVGLEAEAVRRGARSLNLQVLIANPPANALYESLGYRQSHLYHYRRQS